MAGNPLSNEQKRAVLDAAERYEAAWRRRKEALRRTLDECGTVADAHPAALDYQMAQCEAVEASDALVRAMWNTSTPTLRVRGRGRDVIYLPIKEDDLFGGVESRTGFFIQRLDIGEDSGDPPRLLGLDD